MKTNRHGKLTLALAAMVFAGQAAAFTLAETPLFVTGNVDPNIVLTLDDSGSMRRAYVPEHCGDTSDCAALDNRWAKSATGNALYYNPNVTYKTPPGATGNLPATLFGAAWRNGYYRTGTVGGVNWATKVNLATGYRPSAYLDMENTPPEGFMGHYNNATDRTAIGVTGADNPGKAYYYVFDKNNTNCTATDIKDNDCYDLVIVSATSGPGGTDERQNFANWYSFYRTRNFATVAGASLAFANIDPNTRVAWQALNTCGLPDTTCDGWTGTYGSNAIRNFSNTTHKGNFFDWLSRVPTNSGTPLLQAMTRAGEYFTKTGENSPYDNDFSTTSSGQHSCRRNFHILMTDGIWTENISVGNVDKTAVSSLPDAKAYSPGQTYNRVYTDDTSNTLSDVAFKYWKTDLTTLTNNVSPVINDEDWNANGVKDADLEIYWNAKNNPASWQHMVNFTIGLGLRDFLAKGGLTWAGDTYSGSYTSIRDGTQNWPAAGPQSGSDPNYGTSAFDLWHAAINSRGEFFSAEAPNDIVDAFASIMAQVTKATPSAAALAANSTKAEVGTKVYQAKFGTTKWDGHLYAYDVRPADGTLSPALWDAATKVPPHGSRAIYTRNGTGTADFQWDNLDCSQKSYLNNATPGAPCTTPAAGDGLGALRLAWLRGDHSAEQRYGGSFRTREVKKFEKAALTDPDSWELGDIISSDPEYVGPASQGYDQLPLGAPGKSDYATFLTHKNSRVPVIYVGANDGMLHAIRASDGVELFAAIPNAVFQKLPRLTSPTYSHTYYVNGSPNSGDAYLNNSLSVAGWNTVVATGLGAGGKSIIAVDATTANSGSAGRFMWEFTDSDMGYTYSQPQIARLNNGKWAAIFGNGYQTSGGIAYLYIVDLADGSVIRKLQMGTMANNGLSTPVLVDLNNDKIMDIAYAGDSQGNLWKVDLSSATAASWGIANASNPLFVATDNASPSNNRQPISVQPVVAPETVAGGYWVFFGTGRFIAEEDVQTTEMNKTQTFYGIWDNGSAIDNTGRTSNKLIAQTVTDLATSNGFDVRVTSDNAVTLSASVRGWYMDLPNSGERVVSEAVTVVSNVNPAENRIVWVTVLPSSDPCDAGGSSWLMETLFNGRRPASPVFDLNGDGAFNASDMVSIGGTLTPITGVKSPAGILDTPTWLDKDPNLAFKLSPGTKGTVFSIGNKGKGAGGTAVRVHWQQLR